MWASVRNRRCCCRTWRPEWMGNWKAKRWRPWIRRRGSRDAAALPRPSSAGSGRRSTCVPAAVSLAGTRPAPPRRSTSASGWRTCSTAANTSPASLPSPEFRLYCTQFKFNYSLTFFNLIFFFQNWSNFFFQNCEFFLLWNSNFFKISILFQQIFF